MTQQVSPTVYSVVASYLGCITIFGIFANVIIFWVVISDNKLKTPMNTILVNLAVSDFGIALIGNPVAFYNAVSGEWRLGHSVCVFYGFFMSLFGICSIFTLTVLAYERYKIICHPFSTSSHLTWEQVMFSIIGVWSLSFIASAPPLLGWGAYTNEAANISCSINWESREWNTSSYIFFLFGLALAAPIFVILFSYYNIVKTLKKVKTMTKRQNIGSVKKVESHVAMMVLLMVIAFFVAWGPYALFSLLIAFTNIEFPTIFTIFPPLFAKSSVCYNPIIYFFHNHQFRKSLLSKLRCHKREDDANLEIRHVQLTKFEQPNIMSPNSVIEIENTAGITTVSNSTKNTVDSVESQIQNMRTDFLACKTLPFTKNILEIRKTTSLPAISSYHDLNVML